MKLGIFASVFPGREPRGVMAAARGAGYTAMQYNLPAPLPGEVGAAAGEEGIEIAAVSATYNMAHPDAAVRGRGLERLRTVAASARFMGARLLTLCTGTLDPDDQWRRHPDNDTREAWRTMLDSMEAAVRIAEEFDVWLGVEPELANVVNTAPRARRLIDELASPRVRIVLDAANLFEVETLERQRAIVTAGVELLADRIAIAHAKDRHADGRFWTAGDGVLDYGHFLGALRSAGFDGPLIAHGLAEEDAARVAAFLRRHLG